MGTDRDAMGLLKSFWCYPTSAKRPPGGFDTGSIALVIQANGVERYRDKPRNPTRAPSSCRADRPIWRCGGGRGGLRWRSAQTTGRLECGQ